MIEMEDKWWRINSCISFSFSQVKQLINNNFLIRYERKFSCNINKYKLYIENTTTYMEKSTKAINTDINFSSTGL